MTVNPVSALETGFFAKDKNPVSKAETGLNLTSEPLRAQQRREQVHEEQARYDNSDPDHG